MFNYGKQNQTGGFNPDQGFDPTGGRDPRDPRNQQQMLPAFGPGIKGLLASQLNQGFGGGTGQWKGLLGDVYDPTPKPNFQYSAVKPIDTDGEDTGGKGPVAPPEGLSQYDMQQAKKYIRWTETDPGMARSLWSTYSPALRTYIMQQMNGGK